MMNRFLLRLMMLVWMAGVGSVAMAQFAPADAVTAVERAQSGQYAQAYDLAGDDPVMTDLVTFLRLRGGGSPFGDYVQFMQKRPDWPETNRLRARAEGMLFKGRAAAEVIAWFKGHDPQTGEGAVRLAEALLQSGQIEDAKAVLEKAWLELQLTDDGHAAIIAAFPDIVAPLHVARTDALLWRWRTDAAKRMAPLLDDDQNALLVARVALIRKTGDVDKALEAVPEALRDTPGLIYDRYNWLSDRGRRDDAIALIRAQSQSADMLGEPFRWSGWRRSLARWTMREGRIDDAYALATKHFLNDGAAFADLEWLAGYLSLTYMDNPVQAMAHFDAARAAVDSPISVGRMEYWRGRAFEALGQDATDAYTKAAMHQTGFYGLLASEKVGVPLNRYLTGADDPRDWQNSDLLDNDLVRAGVTLLAAGERARAVPFFVTLGKTLAADDLSRLGALLSDMDEPYFEVVIGKTAVTRGVLVPSIYFPIHDLAQMDLPAPPALSLSIARRESEFNAGVGSPVGALGLMQLMPATAEEVAGILDLPYARSRLTADWAYNAQLGAKYLDMLEDEFGPSVVQIAAGYNAGPSRPKIWMDERGDPRLGEVDVVDWIEHIPFRETRNYVMRVSESIPVYQARLSGQTGPVQFTALLNGEKPIVRPVLRPVVAPADIATSDAPPRRAVARPDVTDGATSLRPIARPGG